MMYSKTKLINYVLFSTWILVCAFFTIDTGAFLYPSLSQTLLGEILIGVFGLISVSCLIISSKRASLTIIDIFVIAWVLFLILHSSFVANAEHYKLNYLVSCLILVILLSKVLKHELLSVSQLECGLLIMLMIQLSYLSLQAIGLIEPYCKLYQLTGVGDNPNTAAILLAMCVPIIIRRLKNSEHTFAFLILLLLTLIFLVVLKCRTAYIGAFVLISIQFIMSSKSKSAIRTLSMKKVVAIIGVGALLISFLAINLYNMKKDSANGRLLVWKLSIQMVVDKPMGHGIGMFERCYNLKQGEYFENGKGTEEEKMRSGIVSMAYNDFLEQGVESGVIGAFFMIAFYIILLFKSYRSKDVEAFSVACAFLIMSMVNFIYSSMQPWIILLVYFSAIMAREKRQIESAKIDTLSISVLSISIYVIMIIYIADIALSQAILKTESDKMKRGEAIDRNELYRLRENISTSSEYYMTLGRIETKCGEYENALTFFDEASKYTSSPSVFFSKFKCLDKMNRTEEGIEQIEILSNIIPQNLSSRVILLNWYHIRNEKIKALSVAQEIANMNMKVVNEKSKNIQRQALQYIYENK